MDLIKRANGHSRPSDIGQTARRTQMMQSMNIGFDTSHCIEYSPPSHEPNCDAIGSSEGDTKHPDTKEGKV